MVSDFAGWERLGCWRDGGVSDGVQLVFEFGDGCGGQDVGDVLLPVFGDDGQGQFITVLAVDGPELVVAVVLDSRFDAGGG